MTVQEFIERDWSDQPQVRDACVALADGLRAGPAFDHYTMGTLQDLARVKDMALLSQAALYLANANIGLLEPSLMYEISGKFVVISHDEMVEYSKGGSVVHPQSGRPMSDQDLFVVFLPGKALHDAEAQ
jgi:hypothetical protein